MKVGDLVYLKEDFYYKISSNLTIKYPKGINLKVIHDKSGDICDGDLITCEENIPFEESLVYKSPKFIIRIPERLLEVLK